MSDTQPIIHVHDEPATYEIRLKGHLPMATICAGLSILWPLQPSDTSHVPNL